MNFTCSHCGQSLDAPSELEGQSIQCPSCGRYIVVPVSAGGFKAAVRSARTASDSPPNAANAPLKVVITRIDLSIGDLMVFFLKCFVAWIPVAFMIGALFMLISLLAVGSCAAAITGAMPHP